MGCPDAPVDRLTDRRRDTPRFIDSEISNLRQGMEQNYLAPATNIDSVDDR